MKPLDSQTISPLRPSIKKAHFTAQLAAPQSGEYIEVLVAAEIPDAPVGQAAEVPYGHTAVKADELGLPADGAIGRERHQAGVAAGRLARRQHFPAAVAVHVGGD